MRLEVQFLGDSISGAIDNLVFSVPEPGSIVLVLIGTAFFVVAAKTRGGRVAIP
jgi:hypothetical protein